MTQTNKNLIINTTDVTNNEIIKVLLTTYETYYDGYEGTGNSLTNEILSYRHYYYDIPHDKILEMCSILHKNRDLIKVEIRITKLFNYNFDAILK